MPVDRITQISDNALLAAFAKGNAEAGSILSQTLLPNAHAHAFHYLHNRADSEHVVQEDFPRL